MDKKVSIKVDNLRKKLEKEGEVIPASFDEVFKEVMRSCPNYLADLLNQILGLDKEMILENMVIQNTEHRISHLTEKRKRSDFLVEVQDHFINLEMNMEYYKGLYEKNEAYMRRLGSEMIGINEDYDVKKIIQINFDCFEPFDERVIVKFQIMDVERHIVETESYEKYHINLEKVKEKYYNINERKNLTKLERELMILVLDKKEEIKEISKGEKELMEVGKKIEDLSFDKKNLTKLERELLILVLDKKEEIKEISKGEKELMEVGKKIEDLSFDINMIGLYDEEEERRKVEAMKRKYHISQGIEQGLEKGFRQGSKKSSLEIAKRMLQNKIDIKVIAECTGLSVNKLQTLREK